MVRQRLSHRMGGVPPDGPFEGVPDHLRHVVVLWLRTAIGDTNGPWRSGAMRELAVRFRVNVPAHWETPELVNLLTTMVDGQDQEIALDLIDSALDVLGPDENEWQMLQRHLSAGASAWKVADDRISLTRVVTDQAQATFDAATAVADEITTEVRADTK